LFAITMTGCLVGTPCAPGRWHYHSSDDQPVVVDDCQTMACDGRWTSPHMAPQSDGMKLYQMPDPAPQRHSDAYAIAPAGKRALASQPQPPAVTACDWQEPAAPAAQATPVSRESARRKPGPSQPTDARSPAPAAPQRTPYSWGFFGAQPRW